MKIVNAKGCTIDGQPATILNVTQKYPTVQSDSGATLTVAWTDVREVMNSDRNFKSDEF